jgi:hypothetical protein
MAATGKSSFGEDFLEIDQPEKQELHVAAMFVNRLAQNQHS